MTPGLQLCYLHRTVADGHACGQVWRSGRSQSREEHLGVSTQGPLYNVRCPPHALSIFKLHPDHRSSFIRSHHTQEDTLFLEFALHRALKDLTNTLLPITGTPTAIWRRTGEILAVGAEFCILTEWNQADVVFRDTEDIPLGERGSGSGKDGSEGWKGCFCWELMEKQRCVPFSRSSFVSRGKVQN